MLDVDVSAVPECEPDAAAAARHSFYLRARTDVDERTKEIMLANLQEVANRRLDVEKANIDDQKQQKIQESKADMEQQVRRIQNRIRSLAIAIPPLPALALGLFVFGARLRRENQGANPNRIVHK